MRIDLSQTLIDTEGEEIMSLKKLCVQALLSGPNASTQESLEKSVERFDLAVKIRTSGDEELVDLSTKEITLINNSVSTSAIKYTPLVIGQVNHLLEGRRNPLLGPEEEDTDIPENLDEDGKGQDVVWPENDQIREDQAE